MLAHDLAKWLLSGPNKQVTFEVAHSMWDFEDASDEYGREAAKALDVEGWRLPDVVAVDRDDAGVVVKVASNLAVVDNLGKPKMPVLDSPPPPDPSRAEAARGAIQAFIADNPDWGCRHPLYADTMRCGEISCSNYINKHNQERGLG
jgi:hypothetical protein